MDKIVNPETNRKVLTHSKKGREVIRRYILQLAGRGGPGVNVDPPPPPPPVPVLPPPPLIRQLRPHHWMVGINEIRANRGVVIGELLGPNYDNPDYVGFCIRGCDPVLPIQYWVVRTNVDPETYRAIIIDIQGGVILQENDLNIPNVN